MTGNVIELRPLCDVREVAAALGVTTRTVWRMRDCGEMPMPIRVRGSLRWRRPDVEQWIENGCPNMRKAAR